MRQVDNFAIACEGVSTADQVIKDISDAMTIDVKKLGMVTRYNGADVLHTRHYVKLNCSVWIKHLLNSQLILSEQGLAFWEESYFPRNKFNAFSQI